MSVKLCFLILGASSSMLEDRNKILEKILDDLHRGNFHPIIKSEVHTPELATGRWLSPGTPVSSINKTDCHDITEISLKVALNTINPSIHLHLY
jgi:hypothetical protein